MPAKTYSQMLVERSASLIAEALWSGSCPITPRPLFRDLPPTIQVIWAKSMTPAALQYSDDPGVSERAAAAVDELWFGKHEPEDEEPAYNFVHAEPL